jgi:signal transduction histidine kinase
MKECDASLAMSVGKRDQPVMNGNLDIPHNRVRLDKGVIRKERLGPDFVRQMNHELRTPLNVIIGLCQYLDHDRETPLNEKQRDTISRMERNAHALLETVNQLLECVRTGKYE